jgi:hypothetical protein
MSTLGVVATIVIGVVGIVLSLIQLQNSRFVPVAIAHVESDKGKDGRRQVSVQITNNGGAPGMIRVLAIEDQSNEQRDTTFAGWTGAGPLPFYLPGRSTARLVFWAEPGEVIDDTDHIRIEYGAEKTKTVGLKPVQLRITDETSLPPGAAPVKSGGPISSSPSARGSHEDL